MVSEPMASNKGVDALSRRRERLGQKSAATGHWRWNRAYPELGTARLAHSRSAQAGLGPTQTLAEPRLSLVSPCRSVTQYSKNLGCSQSFALASLRAGCKRLCAVGRSGSESLGPYCHGDSGERMPRLVGSGFVERLIDQRCGRIRIGGHRSVEAWPQRGGRCRIHPQCRRSWRPTIRRGRFPSWWGRGGFERPTRDCGYGRSCR